MTYRALVEHFAKIEELPIPTSAVLAWIREHTDHKDFRLHAVARQHKAFRGAFRRTGIPKGAMYSHEYDIVTEILYGKDLEDEWKRLVIVKEVIHVFGPAGSYVDTPENVKRLIPQVITPELQKPPKPFMPAVDDHLGAYRAMAVLLPRRARNRLKKAVDAGHRTTTEVANYVKLPAFYVGIWLDIGMELEPQLMDR